MAEIATLARPYAEAVFKLADEQQRLGDWSGWLRAMAAVAAHPEVQACIGNPQVSAGQLYELFLAACPDGLPAEAKNLGQVLIRNRRLELLPEIRAQFEALKLEREGVVDADIESAFPLDEAQVAALVADLERKFRRKISPRVRVERDLIGGVRVTVGDEVIDGSVRSKLAAMASAIAKV
ncbi:MAG: F0F1 ATP synthase subunit delta [Burkholderiales bacterium]